MMFIPEQPKDYCFARAFGIATKEDGEARWPSLRGHESDCIKEMEEMLSNAVCGKEIDSEDRNLFSARSAE